MKTGKVLIEEINAYRSHDNSCAFWWLGQLGYIFKSKDLILAFDPYLNPAGSRLIPPLIQATDLMVADYIFGSHNHGDHIDNQTYSLLAEASHEARFVVPELTIDTLSEKLSIDRAQFIGMDDGSVYWDREKDLKITGIAAAHEFLDRDTETGRYPYLGYIIDTNGLRIYHAGDTCKYDGLEAKLSAFGEFDIMFVPINGRSGKKYRSGTIGNMNYAEAVDLCGMLEVKLAVPGHYEMFENNSANPIDFLDFMEAKYPARRVWIGGHGEMVEYHR